MRLAVAVLLASTVARADALDELATAMPACDDARATCLGIHLHVAVTDTGPVATKDWLASQLAAANRHFATLDAGFQLVGIDALPASASRIEDRRERNALGRKLPGRVIHVFVTGQLDDVDKEGAVAFGVTWPGAGKKFVIVSTQAWERTLAHELGHVFGLPHSAYPISIMNKTERAEPPLEQRTFADEELAKMRPRMRAMVRAKLLANLRARR